MLFKNVITLCSRGSGCGSVCRVVHGSNPFIDKKLFIEHLFAVNSIEKTKIKKKGPEIAHFIKNIL